MDGLTFATLNKKIALIRIRGLITLDLFFNDIFLLLTHLLYQLHWNPKPILSYIELIQSHLHITISK